MSQTTPLKIGDKIDVKIEKLVYGGSGLARHQSFVVFVPFSSPGDELKVEITKTKKSYAEAKIHQILKSGPHRVNAPCPVFGKCGGCDWQNTDYTEQLAQKKEILKESLSSFYKKDIPWFQDSPWHYRNRARFKVKNNTIGFNKKSSHEIVSALDCKIIDKKLLEKIRNVSKEDIQKAKSIEVFFNEEGQIQLTYNKKTAEESGFSQVNTKINQALIKEVSRWISKEKPKQIYDFFCGKGNFSEALMQKDASLKITAVDISKKNIELAKTKASTVNYIRADLNHWLTNESLKEDSFILLDPPRDGLEKDFLHHLSQSKWQNICYISCNPMTLKRDLKTFLTFNAFKMSDVKAFDMFPQTYHFEVACLIER